MTILALLAARRSEEPVDPEEPTEPEIIPEAWRNVVAGARFIRATHASPSSIDQTNTFTLMEDAEQVRLTFTAAGGWASDGAAPAGGDITYTASVNGTQVTWGGQPSGVCPDGLTVTSDPVTINGTAGQELTIHTVATGTYVAGGIPLKVSALSNRPSVLIIGSSSGMPDDFVAGFKNAGLAVCNASIGGSRAFNFSNITLRDRMGMGDGDHGFTHAFLQVGINSNGRGVTEMCQGAVDLAWRLRDLGVKHVAQKVWKPHTTSTDGWTTAEGQAPRFNDRAIAVAWLRRGAPVTADGRTYDLMGTAPGALYAGQPGHPFDEVVDWSVLLQDASVIDAFRVDHGPLTTDGLHINSTGYELGRPAIQAWAQDVADRWSETGGY